MLLFLAFILSAGASNDEQNGASIASWGYLEDAGSALRIDDILQIPADAFKPLPSGLMSLGFTRAVHWIRFEIHAPPGVWLIDILPPYLDDLRLFTPEAGRAHGYLERVAGDHYPIQDREVAYRGFAFRLHQSSEGNAVCFLRIQSTSTHLLVMRLWAEKAFFGQMALEAGTVYALLAVLMTFLILNLNNWFWLRQPVLLWLCAYITSLTFLYSVNMGFANQYLLPQSGNLNDLCLGIGNMLVMTSSSGFYPCLFGIDSRQRIITMISRIGFWLPIAGLAGVIGGYYPEVMPTLLVYYLLVTVMWVVVSWRLLDWKEPDAVMIFLATLTGLLGIFVTILNVQGFLLGGLVILYSMVAASIIQVMLLHLAIAARYRRVERDRIRQEHERDQAIAEAERERRERAEQSGLFAMISHEIRTPLAMILGAVNSLENLVYATDEITRRHDRIRRAVNRIDELVDKALRYDRVEWLAKDTIDARPVDLGRVVTEVIGGRSLRPGRLVHSVTNRSILISGQRFLLEMMISNLIDNALKYTPDSSMISVALAVATDQALLVVEDNGSGISGEIRSRLFGRYVRGADTGAVPGVGLGLFLVDRIVRLHGGRISYDPVEPTGSRFSIELPLMMRENIHEN